MFSVVNGAQWVAKRCCLLLRSIPACVFLIAKAGMLSSLLLDSSMMENGYQTLWRKPYD